MYENLEISISGSDPTSSSVSQAWIKLTLDPPEKQNEISKKELAAFLNAAYGITDPCRGLKDDDAYVPGDPDDSTEQRLQEALSGQGCYEAADLLAMHQQCNPLVRSGIPQKFNVYVHCSSEQIRERYKFRCSSDISPSGPTQAQSVIQVIIDFSDADEVPIYRFAESDEVRDRWIDDPPQWLGDVLVGAARVDSGTIGVGWSNGRVVLTEPVSGRLVVRVPIKYDIFSASVPGTVIGGKRDYTATAFAFEESLSGPAQVEIEDEQDDPAEGGDCELCGGDDTAIDRSEIVGVGIAPPAGDCQRRIDWELRNKCTDKLIDFGTRYEPCPCPNQYQSKPEVTYTSAQTPASARYTEEEFAEECCEPPKKASCLPCKEIISTYHGGAPIKPSEQYWRDRYAPAQVVFNRVGVEGGGPCGTRTDSFEAGSCDACSSVTEISYDDRSPDIVADGSSVTVYFSGGKYPATATVGGNGFYLDSEDMTEKEVSSGAITIYTRDSCGVGTVTLDDSCSSDNGKIRSTNSVLVTVEDTIQDGVALVSCSTPEYEYTDDWCDTNPNTCTGDGDRNCKERPEGAESDWKVEGNLVRKYQCP